MPGREVHQVDHTAILVSSDFLHGLWVPCLHASLQGGAILLMPVFPISVPVSFCWSNSIPTNFPAVLKLISNSQTWHFLLSLPWSLQGLLIP